MLCERDEPLICPFCLEPFPLGNGSVMTHCVALHPAEVVLVHAYYGENMDTCRVALIGAAKRKADQMKDISMNAVSIRFQQTARGDSVTAVDGLKIANRTLVSEKAGPLSTEFRMKFPSRITRRVVGKRGSIAIISAQKHERSAFQPFQEPISPENSESEALKRVERMNGDSSFIAPAEQNIDKDAALDAIVTSESSGACPSDVDTTSPATEDIQSRCLVVIESTHSQPTAATAAAVTNDVSQQSEQLRLEDIPESPSTPPITSSRQKQSHWSSSSEGSTERRKAVTKRKHSYNDVSSMEQKSASKTGREAADSVGRETQMLPPRRDRRLGSGCQRDVLAQTRDRDGRRRLYTDTNYSEPNLQPMPATEDIPSRCLAVIESTHPTSATAVTVLNDVSQQSEQLRREDIPEPPSTPPVTSSRQNNSHWSSSSEGSPQRRKAVAKRNHFYNDVSSMQQNSASKTGRDAAADSVRREAQMSPPRRDRRLGFGCQRDVLAQTRDRDGRRRLYTHTNYAEPNRQPMPLFNTDILRPVPYSCHGYSYRDTDPRQPLRVTEPLRRSSGFGGNFRTDFSRNRRNDGYSSDPKREFRVSHLRREQQHINDHCVRGGTIERIRLKGEMPVMSAYHKKRSIFIREQSALHWNQPNERRRARSRVHTKPKITCRFDNVPGFLTEDMFKAIVLEKGAGALREKVDKFGEVSENGYRSVNVTFHSRDDVKRVQKHLSRVEIDFSKDWSTPGQPITIVRAFE